MSYGKRDRVVLIGILVGMVMLQGASAFAVETGPVDRKWGLGWDNGLTARLWLGGVWELGLAAGPDDFLRDETRYDYDTGSDPYWNERRETTIIEDRTESGFVRLQGGRLISRRGPLAAVCYMGLQYLWTDSRYVHDYVDEIDPEDSYTRSRDNDSSIWSLSLGLRPSYEIMDFLTVEMAFGLIYSWRQYDDFERSEYPSSGRVQVDSSVDKRTSFDYFGWNGMYSLQFIVWF